jgi:hypothetical protein
MYNDLARISKAKGIYRTLSLLAILSSGPDRHENAKHLPLEDKHNQGKHSLPVKDTQRSNAHLHA